MFQKFVTAGVWLVLFSLLGSNRMAAQDTNDPELNEKIDRYIDLRYSANEGSTQELLNDLGLAGVKSPEMLEKLLRRKRNQYPDSTELFGKTTIHEIECQHVDYSTRYFMTVPEGIDLEKPVSLVIVGHGGNSSMSQRRAEGTARAYIQAYRSLAEPMNAILVAPASGRGWGQIGNSLVFSVLSQVQRKFPIDPDRIFITGQSMGGHLSYRSALSLPDRFGATSPHSGGYDFVEKQSIANLINIPGYAIWGKREPYGINKDNRTNQKWAEDQELDWTFVEKNGGHEIYGDELPNVAKFFNEHPRDLYRDAVYLRLGGAMKFVNTWKIKGWPEHKIYSEEKPLRWNMRHWVQVEPREDAEGPYVMLAKNRGGNRFEVTCENVRDFSIFLHPKMIDFEQPVVVMANGNEIFNKMVGVDPTLMFDLAREFDDRGRVFWARVVLKVNTDKAITLDNFDWK